MTDTIDRSDQSSASTPHDAEVIDRLVVRFAGDSGDGMQLTGDRFTSVSATFGNDLSTMPDFPATSATTTSPPRATSPTCWWR